MRWYEWIIFVFLIIFVFAFVGAIVNYISCFWYWNTPMLETPARCIHK